MADSLESLLKDVRERFLKDVDAKHIAREAYHKSIISEEHVTRIEKAESTKAANEILFMHLYQQATQSSLEKVCKIMTDATGYTKMQNFGETLRDKISAPRPVVPQDVEIQAPAPQFKDPKLLRQNESLEKVDRMLVLKIRRIARQRKRRWFAVRNLYRLVCRRFADSLDGRLAKIKFRVHENYIDKYTPYDMLTQTDMKMIRSCTTVDHIMHIVGISKQWLDVSYLEEFYIDMADHQEESSLAELWLYRYKQLLQYLCSKVLLRIVPHIPFLKEQLQAAEASLESSRILTVIHDLDYKHFSVRQLLNQKECWDKIFDIPPGRLNLLRAEDGHSMAIYWLIDKRYVARVMLGGRPIFWPLLEHQVTSLELVGALTLSLKGGHVPYLIRDALLSGQDLIQQTEVFSRQFLALVGLTDSPLENETDVRHRRLCSRLLEALKSDRPCLQGRRINAQSTAASVRTGHPHSQVDGSLLLPSAPELPIARFEDSTVEEDVSQTLLERQAWDEQHQATTQEAALDVLIASQPGQRTVDESRDVEAEQRPEPIESGSKRKRKRKRKPKSRTVEQDAPDLPLLEQPPVLERAVPRTGTPELLAAPDHSVELAMSERTYQATELPETLPEELLQDKTMGATPVEPLPQEDMEEKIDLEDYFYPKVEVEVEEEHEVEPLQTDVPEMENKDKTKKVHSLIKAEGFALVCEQCSDQLSDVKRMHPLGTCADKTHIKRMIVRPGSLPVRNRILPDGRNCKMSLCNHYPNCFKGYMCELAHGEEELHYWRSNPRPGYELCLDCKLQAAEGILQHCHTGKHVPVTVVYVDEESREIVPVPLPRNVGRMSKPSKFRAHLPSECRNPQFCSFPHHQLAAKIMNQWRDRTVKVSKPPTLKRYFEELKLTSHFQTDRKRGPGPRPEEVLEEELESFPDRSLTCANYLQKFHVLIDLEEHTHMKTLAKKYNGTFTFIRVGEEEMKKLLLRYSQVKTYEWVGVLLMSSLKAHPLRQAAVGASLHFMDGTTLVGDILQQPTNFNFEHCLSLGFPPKSEENLLLPVGTHKETITPPQLESNYWRVDAEFILKHNYFTSLRKSLWLVPAHAVQRLVPSEVMMTSGEFENPDSAVIESEEDYPVLENFALDVSYQEAAFTKVMEANSSAPFIITGPFGAGKTRLIATTALRILLHNADCFILIATHHNKTATEYIERYYKPLLEQTFDHRENLGVVRVVNSRRDLDSKKMTSQEQSISDKPAVDSTEKYVKTVDELDSEDIDDYNLIITTFGVMLRLKTILKKRKCKFFTHIFVDEGAQAREPETVGAFCFAGPTTKIVIAGDHRQVGPQTSVLGKATRQNGMSLSLVARLHKLYTTKLKHSARNYQAVMLSNHRTHTSIMCLPSSLFYGSTVHSQSKSELHPDYKKSLNFVCTSLDLPHTCAWHDDEEYDVQVRKEVEAAIDWVKKCAENWPEVEWEKKDLESLCVIVPNRHVERLWKNYARAAQLSRVTCQVAYDIQGREFRAIFICTSEAVDENCATRDTVKSLCDQYVFNTVITRARSLVMAFGNPFRLMEIEKQLANVRDVTDSQGESMPITKCWQTFFYHCLQCNSLVLSDDLNLQRQESRQLALEQSTRLLELESVMFERASEGLLKLDQLEKITADSILAVYNKCFEDQYAKLKLNATGGQFSWRCGSSQPVHQPPTDARLPPGTPVIQCRLWQDTQHQCTAVPVDPKQKPLQVKGVENRRCAFDGALVNVRVLDHSGRYGAVHTVEEQGFVGPHICEVDRLSSSVFSPVDKKSPRLINLPYIARNVFEGSITGEGFEKDQEKREQYVLLFDPAHLKLNQVPKISYIIPNEVASLLLFVVQPLCWSWEHRYPLGAVVAALPKGISELYANKVLAIQYQVPAPDSDLKLNGVDVEESLPAACTTAIGIVSRGGHSSVALSVDFMGADICVVGIYVCNVADLVAQSEEFNKATFKRWAGVLDQYQKEYHPTLPKDMVQGLSFSNGGVQKTITFTVEVRSPGIGELIKSREVLAKPQNIELAFNPFEESTVSCSVMLEMDELEGMLKILFSGAQVPELLQKKITDSALPLWEMVTALYFVSDHLCFMRQGYRGYPELQQVPEAFVYPEAWKLLHELLTCASCEAAKSIGTAFRSTTLLKVQPQLPQESIQKICDEYAFLLNVIPLYQWMAKSADVQQEFDFTWTNVKFDKLLGALKRFDIMALQQLLMQPHYHPQLAVLEACIREALPREEFVVKKIASKSKQVQVRPIVDLIEEAGGRHHSLQSLVSPYSCPFDNVFDIYVQYLLLRAIQKQGDSKDGAAEVEPSRLTDNLSTVVRCCNVAAVNSKKYDSSVTSLNLAIHGQWSSIRVEAFVKEMKNGNIQLCYSDPVLQSVSSVQAIETKYVTSSKKAKFVLYTAKVTCVDKPCHMLSNLCYTFLTLSHDSTDESEEAAETASMAVFYRKGRRLAKSSITPHYKPSTVSLSEKDWHEATGFLKNPQEKDAHHLRHFLHQDIIREAPVAESSQAPSSPTEEEIKGAPLFILKVPFVLTPCQVANVWLRTDMNEYVLTPKPQLLELNSDVRICLQHKSDILSCFTRCAFAESPTAQYSSYKTYSRIWAELFLAEAAYTSVNGTDQYIFTDFELNFSAFHIPPDCTSEEFYEPVGDIWAILPKEFLATLQDIFPIEAGYFSCFRFDVELKEDKEEDRALLEKHKRHLYPGATDNHVRTVMHMVVDSVRKLEDNEEKEDIRMTLEERVIKNDVKVKFKVVGRHNARLSPLMKDVLEKKKPRCEMQLFQMFLPHRKVYQAFRMLHHKDRLVTDVALGRLDRLVGPQSLSVFSAETIKKLLLENRFVLRHWDDSARELNDIQTKTLMSALMNRFQLIQGPPGTGKSITGAHIAYAFALLNRERKRREAEADKEVEQSEVNGPSGLPPLKCVLYCGPSNPSVDVVLDHLNGIASTSQADRLRILRLYGKGIEKQYHDHPYYEEDLFGKPVEFDIQENLKHYSLHHLVRTRSSYKEKIKHKEEEFRKLHEEGFIPIADERFEYREWIRNAEEEVIKTGDFDIILCTCNETSGLRFRSNVSPIQCIIDEAAMTTEPEAILALSEAEQAVLIGDHMQLQPVVQCKEAAANGLAVSLFERYARLFRKKYPKGCPNFHQLLKQYRMVPAICEFPSDTFYEEPLITKCTENRFPINEFWLPKSAGPIVFCDIVGTEEDEESKEEMKNSKKNEREADKTVEVVNAIDAMTGSGATIAVITPYRAQKLLITKKLGNLKENWMVRTIDASQGSEADFVVLSMVRSKPLHEIEDKRIVQADTQWIRDNLGIVSDSHRLCVALTRARFGLVIIGNQTLLSYDELWADLITHCKNRKYVVYRKDEKKFPPRGPVNQAKAAVERRQKHKPEAVALKPQAVALKPKEAKGKLKVKFEVEMELDKAKVLEILEDLLKFQTEFLERKPPMWQDIKKERTEEAASSLKPFTIL